MFGTFEAYRPEEEIVYGLVDPVQSFNPLYLQVNSSFIDLFSKLPETDSSNERKKSPFFYRRQVFYFGKMYEKWNAMDGWKNKLSSLIKGPGWRPGSPWTGFIDEVPDVRSPPH